MKISVIIREYYVLYRALERKFYVIFLIITRVMEPITGRLLLSAPPDQCQCSVVIHLILIYMNQNISKVGFCARQNDRIAQIG